MKAATTAAAILALGLIPSAFGKIKVVGAMQSSGKEAVPYRPEINSFAGNGGPTWDLYVQALSQMYGKSDDDLLSYFQIAGVHGLPFIDWGNSTTKQGSDWLGFCPHNEPIFGPWHRPYLLLFEQVLVSTAKDIAAKYPSKYLSAYQQAASNLRLPYWDWARSSNVPPVTTYTNVSIKVPNSANTDVKTVSVANPLYTYNYPDDANKGKFGQFQDQNQTTRCKGKGQSYPSTANSNMAGRPYKQWTYDAFTLSQDFEDFMTTGTSGISLELIHNGVHNDAACRGQFLDASLSAFEPLFYLHHTQVDRLYAMWQAINPGQAKFYQGYYGGSRYGTPKDSPIYSSSSLKPFYDVNGKFYTTDSVTSYYKMGYAYEGLEYWKLSADQLAASAKSMVNTLYGSGSSSKRGLLDFGAETSRYFVEMSVDLAQVQRPAEVVIGVKGNHAGSIILMSQPPTGVLHGGFSLDDAVVASGLGLFNILDVLKTLTDELDIEIIKADGSKIPLSSVPSLNVQIIQKNITAPLSLNLFPDVTGSKNKTVIRGRKPRRSEKLSI